MHTRYSVVWVYHIYLINSHFTDTRSAALGSRHVCNEQSFLYILWGLNFAWGVCRVLRGCSEWRRQSAVERSREIEQGLSWRLLWEGKKEVGGFWKITENMLLPSKVVFSHWQGGNSPWEVWPWNWAVVYACVGPLWKVSMILQNGA